MNNLSAIERENAYLAGVVCDWYKHHDTRDFRWAMHIASMVTSGDLRADFDTLYEVYDMKVSLERENERD